MICSGNIFCIIVLLLVDIVGIGYGFEKLRICVADSLKWNHSWLLKNCEYLKQSKQHPVGCVVATDRYQCIHYVSIGKADFTIMEAEDQLIVSQWKDSNILLVAELKTVPERAYEYGVVAVIRNGLNLTSLNDLRRAEFCHPGYGPDMLWSDLYTEYFEERIVPVSCDPNLSSLENRIKSSSSYFAGACKAGPWSYDPAENDRLKIKYPKLCSSCDLPNTCSLNDKYRGTSGSLLCLTDYVGDVVWAKFDDVRSHFQLYQNPIPEDDTQYSYLCPDGSLKPLSTSEPCLWLARPWQVVATNKKSVNLVRSIMEMLVNDNDVNDWKESLEQVMMSYKEFVTVFDTVKTTEDYLESVPGFLSSSTLSQDNCNYDNSISWCTTSYLELTKCERLSAVSAAVGLRPRVKCSQEVTVDHCMTSVASGVCDVVVVDAEQEVTAINKHGLQTILSESPADSQHFYQPTAIVSKNSNTFTLADLRNKKACFGKYNGVSWNVVLNSLQQSQMIINDCTQTDLNTFFSHICVTHVDKERVPTVPLCKNNTKDMDELNILVNLMSGECDVAFMDLGTFYTVTDKSQGSSWKPSEFRMVCLDKDKKNCTWSWTSRNHVMAAVNVTTVKLTNIKNYLTSVSRYFGSTRQMNYNTLFTLFGPLFGQKNILFSDTASSLKNWKEIEKEWDMPRSYQSMLNERRHCSSSTTTRFNFVTFGLLLLIILYKDLLPD